MKQLLCVLETSPYGSEKAYQQLRLAVQLLENAPQNSINLRVFCVSDGVYSTLPHQQSEEKNIGMMLEILLAQKAAVSVCKTCLAERGLSAIPLMNGVEVGTLHQLVEWTLQADQRI